MLKGSSEPCASRTGVSGSRRSAPLVAAVAAMVGIPAIIAACAVDTVDPSQTSTKPTSTTTDPGGSTGGSSSTTGGTGTVPPPPPPPPADAGVDIPDATGTPVQDPSCDMNGRWLVAQRVLATAIGQDQAAHNWFYYEIRHEGANTIVTKGLHCGFEVIKKSALSAAVDSSGAWTALMERSNSNGRKGTYVKAGAGCNLTLAKEYVVRGATVPYYLTPGNPLPAKDKPALNGQPGWEDWDGDGNPGISLKASSALASGTLYVEQRDWTQYSGATSGTATKFKVSITYNGEQVALGRAAGAPQAIETASAPSADATQHYAWFAKLADGQATGADAEICKAVRTLKDTLVPEAGQ